MKLKNGQHLLAGNDRFEGFAIDLLADVSALLQFKYQLYIAPDGLYGSRSSTGTWAGAIGELINGVRFPVSDRVSGVRIRNR